jgi:ArsR family transcriptional regulator, lead/cadmium/zinc/bismuth-responsive transcriptional repressor
MAAVSDALRIAVLHSERYAAETIEHPYTCANGGRVAGMATERDTCDLLCLDLPKAERARKRLPDPHYLVQQAGAARALGDPTRLAVAIALSECGSACVCDLAWVVGRDEKLVSHHVRQLRSAGLAVSSREGKMVMYELTAAGRHLLSAVFRSGEVRA